MSVSHLRSLDADFCAVCGAILPLSASSATVDCRACGHTTRVQKKKNHLVCRLEKVYERTVADTENAEDKGGADAVVDHICTKCGHGKATWATMQTRSADEGQTVFYTCLKCKKKDIEYS